MQIEFTDNFQKCDSTAGDCVGKLIICDRSISLHIEGHDDPLATNFITKHEGFTYKIFTTGSSGGDETGYFYSIIKVVVLSDECNVDIIDSLLENVNGFKIDLPGLSDWLNIKTVDAQKYKNGKFIIREKLVSPIKLLDNPAIEIDFIVDENRMMSTNNSCALIKAPFIFVGSHAPMKEEQVFTIIKTISTFFALLRGTSETNNDIRICCNNDVNAHLIYNNSFFYNSPCDILRMLRPTFVYTSIASNLNKLFEKWYGFYTDDLFMFIVDEFFHAPNKSVVEAFLTYCRYIEGYDLRKTNVESKANELCTSIKAALNTSEMAVFADYISNEYKKFGSSCTKNELSKWISSGLVNKKPLSQIIKSFDRFHILSEKQNIRYILYGNDPDEKFDIYNSIQATRNYYSHFKADSNGILNYQQIRFSLICLELTIKVSMFAEMGLSDDEIKKALVNDTTYWVLSHHLKT